MIVFFDPAGVREQLLPLTFTRPVGAIRMGALTMAERWLRFFDDTEACWLSEPYLSEMFPEPQEVSGHTLFIAGNVLATQALATEVRALTPGQALMAGEAVVAHRGPQVTGCVCSACDVMMLSHVYDIFLLNAEACRVDFDLLTRYADRVPLHQSNTVIGREEDVYVHPTATVLASTLNTTDGPIYIGPEATVMEGSNLRGPVTVCRHATVNMGTRIYGATTIGPWCKVGGELNNVVMQAYSNKGHDGFLGNAVIGEWCNLGGGTVASNLKNDYSEVRLWNYPSHRFLRTGLQFCGLIMGDHSKSAINTSFNTATVVGVGCNIVSEGMPRVFIPSFSKGGSAGFENVNMAEFFTIAERVMARRGVALTDAYRHMCHQIYDFADRFK